MRAPCTQRTAARHSISMIASNGQHRPNTSAVALRRRRPSVAGVSMRCRVSGRNLAAVCICPAPAATQRRRRHRRRRRRRTDGRSAAGFEHRSPPEKGA
jgi:hypothetical protein